MALFLLCASLCILGMQRGVLEFHAQRFLPDSKGVLTGTVAEVSYHEYSQSQYVLSEASFDGKRLETGVVITVYGYFDAQVADVIRCTVKLRPIENYEDAEYDYKTWRLSQNIAYQATGNKAEIIGHSDNPRYWPARAATLLNGVMTSMYGDKAGMAIGMTLGFTDQMSEEDMSSFRAAGIAHVLSVSGLNFAFFMVALQWILGRRTYASTSRFLITLALLWGYCAVVGMPASAVRACLMLSLYLLANWAGWQYDLLTSICLAAAVITAARPAQLFTAGFCLSFSATMGIVLFCAPFTDALSKIKFMPKWLASALGVWASAQLGILPFLIYFFHTVQLYGAISNIVVVPLSSVVTVGGLISALLGLILLPLAKVIAWVVGWACAAISAVARLCAGLPAAQIGVQSMRLSWLFGYCAIALIFSRYCLLSRRTKWIVVGAIAAIALVIPV